MRQIRSTITKTATVATALAAGLVLSIGGSANATQAAATIHGCPSGAVCLYPDDSWSGDKPTYKFYSYGAHKIYNQYGMKRIFNNQTGGAIARNCYDSAGKDCGGIQRAGTYADYNYTPYNSILLAP
ncbi:hypothetical protein [Streptomyces lomondensis]|uniref:Peptidase inhibitor family I36 n=1 Tax=Streptomyces lomondensis TaxID=68229 RepID=A0ABQ2WZZ7_9ACTN|nr:hypothetical protein [Streptomyces lomondensis]MCF0076162.1 hypothetical protein [Streptomyces lomondensis]GGW88540.1 hypothetical protein GCM10010383_16830 [Streptomyces lomondensis]